MIFHILALLLFIFMIGISIFSIKRNYQNNNKLITILASFLLLYKVIELSYGIFIKGNPAKYPVEYSTIYYFFFPLVLLTNSKRLMGLGTTGAFISGLAYLVSLIFNINNMIETQSAINNMPGFLIGMLSHSILFYLAILIMKKEKFNYKKEVLLINLFTTGIALHAYFIGTIIDFSEYYLFIYLVITAELAGPLASFFQTNFLTMVLYFIVAYGIYNACIVLFYKVNSYLNKDENININ